MTTARNAVLAVLVVASIVQLAVVLRFCNYGFEFSDGGAYVILISIPEAYRTLVPVSLFGFVYKPLYLLLGGDIAVIRQANVLLTLLLAFALCHLALREVFAGVMAGSRFAHLATSFSLSTLSLAYFAPYGATPSYNSLAFQAVTLALCGLLLLDAQQRAGRVAAILAIGIGGWLAFMAKPSTALALALAVPLCAVAIGGLTHVASLLCAAAVASCLVLASALAIDGSIMDFVHRLERSMALLGELGSRHDVLSILRIDWFPLSEVERTVAAIAITLVIILSMALQHGTELVRRLAAFACAVVALATACVMIRGWALQIDAWVLFTISGFVALAAAVWRAPAVSRKAVVLTLLFLIVPHVYAFGTNNNYWTQGSMAALYWVLAAALLLGPLREDPAEPLALVPVTIVAQAILALLLNDGIARPYRQSPQSLRENASALRLGPQGTVILSEGFAQYISDARLVAAKAGFPAGAPTIDLTGQSPGLLFALGARGLGLAWIVGGYPGSTRYAVGVLDRVACRDIAAAWLLVETGARSLDVDVVLSHLGTQRSDYQEVGSFKTAIGAGGYPQQRVQWLLKPLRAVEVAAQACEAARVGSGR
jgi:hypothetical protein